MRTVLILLLLANLTLFGYTRLDRVAGGEPARLAEQVDPGKIRILSAKGVADLGPAKVAALADVCLEWAPLTDAERTRALSELAPLNLGTLATVRKAEVQGMWSPTLGPFAMRAQAERRLADLRARGVPDVALVETGAEAFVLAFGVYRTEAQATARADALGQQGVPGARAVMRTRPVNLNVIVVRDPSQPVLARLKELQSALAGSDLKVGTCERTS